MMMPFPSMITQYYDQFTNWLLNKSLPYWGHIGCDGPAHCPYIWGAHEQLKMNGVPDLPGYKRLRVQARQLYTFSQAALLGWTPAYHIADHIYRFMNKAQQGEGWWAKTLTREGNILDSSADLYDLAFVIFSLAWYGKMTGNNYPIQQARQTVRWIERFMPYPDGGFKNTFPATKKYRQQNPHMHLLEASLALFEITQEEQDLVLAHKLIHLFTTRFFNKQAGILGEYYTENWNIAPYQEKDIIEPGHQYEWIWLLNEYQSFTGINYDNEISRMFLFNRRYAVDQQTGLVADKAKADGTLTHKSARLWVQTEALRATVLMTDEKNRQHLSQILYNLLYRYFTPTGTWQDQLDDQYQPGNSKIPTSSFYHIMSSYIQLRKTLNLSTLSTGFPTIHIS